jgi:hypothetical protein
VKKVSSLVHLNNFRRNFKMIIAEKTKTVSKTVEAHLPSYCAVRALERRAALELERRVKENERKARLSSIPMLHPHKIK